MYVVEVECLNVSYNFQIKCRVFNNKKNITQKCMGFYKNTFSQDRSVLGVCLQVHCTTIKHTNIIYIVKEVNKNLVKHYTDFKALFGKKTKNKRHLCTDHSQQEGKN